MDSACIFIANSLQVTGVFRASSLRLLLLLIFIANTHGGGGPPPARGPARGRAGAGGGGPRSCVLAMKMSKGRRRSEDALKTPVTCSELAMKMQAESMVSWSRALLWSPSTTRRLLSPPY
jgi:hypothetical protein